MAAKKVLPKRRLHLNQRLKQTRLRERRKAQLIVAIQLAQE